MPTWSFIPPVWSKSNLCCISQGKCHWNQMFIMYLFSKENVIEIKCLLCTFQGKYPNKIFPVYFSSIETKYLLYIFQGKYHLNKILIMYFPRKCHPNQIFTICIFQGKCHWNQIFIMCFPRKMSSNQIFTMYFPRKMSLNSNLYFVLSKGNIQIKSFLCIFPQDWNQIFTLMSSK